MTRLGNKPLAAIFIATMFAFVSSRCAQNPARSPKPSPDWSRGTLVGEDAIGSPSILADAEDGHIDMVWPVNVGEDQQTLYYAQLDQMGILVDEYNFPFSSLQVRVPHILPAAEAKFHVFWESRSVSGGKWSLWYGLLDVAEKSFSTPALISTPDVDIKNYHLVGDTTGGAFVVWETNKGIFGAHLDASGSQSAEPAQITIAGESPFLCVENDRALMAWQTDSGIRFQRFDTRLEASEGTIIATPRLGGSEHLYGPVMGTSGSRLYVAWSIRRQTGLEAGTASTEFVSFQLDQPKEVVPTTIYILPTILEPDKAYDGVYTLTKLVPAPVSAPSSSEYIYNPVPVSNPQGEFALAITAKQTHQNKLATQIVLTLFRDGDHIGYLQAVATQTLSSSPSLTSDRAGNLHLAWREGYDGSDVYYATTASTARKNLDQLQSLDFIEAILSGIVEGFASLLLVPLIGVMWIFPGFVLLAIFKLIRDMESMDTWLSWLVLAIGLISYQALKWFTFLPLHSYVPFSAWIDMPAAWNMILRWGAPALIFGLALIVAEWRRRSRSCSVLVYYLIVTIIDVSLTMIVYGVNVIGLG